jgi:hypothetical protein
MSARTSRTVRIAILVSLLATARLAVAQPSGDRISLATGSWYLLGVNYPWLYYGHDFGTTAWGHDGVSAAASTTQIDADFASLRSQGVHVVRWFLFGDCRAAPEFDGSGHATGFDDYFYADLDAAIAIARKHDIHLIPVLFDFLLADSAQVVNGVQMGGRSTLISNSGLRQSLLDNALRPLLERYGASRTILAWEVMNEPEGAMNIPGGGWVAMPVSAGTMQSFVRDVVGYIHAYASQQATLGSASRGQLGYWEESGLDFYQYHYYDVMEGSYPLDVPCAQLGLDKPCIVGEFPTKNTSRSITEYLNTIYQNGYAGALAWSYRAGDERSGFSTGASAFLAWSQAHDLEVNIPSESPVYRFWSPKNGRHFYTIGESERDKLILTYPSSVWTYEGIAYYAFTAATEAGVMPVYRFWSPKNATHFYTISESEKNKVITKYSTNVWTYEGVAFYAYPSGSQPEGAMPIYRFWSPKNGTHFYTMSESEKEKLVTQYPSSVWTYEAIAWYAYE